MVDHNEYTNVKLTEKNVHDPAEFFHLFFDESIFEYILNESVLYSKNEISMGELKSVFGVLLASGVCQLPKRRDYWSTNSVKQNKAISDSIGQKRFEQIFSYLHFVPHNFVPCPSDRFQKVRLLISKLNKNFQEFGPITNSFSVDETMVPYYGRHGAKQFIKGKPVRFGFKNWALASSKGYVTFNHIQEMQKNLLRAFHCLNHQMLFTILEFFYDNCFQKAMLQLRVTIILLR